MKVAILPARGSSQRIPDKNITPVLNRPMITYPLEAALASELFDAVFVSTDSAKVVAAVESRYRGGVHFIPRPASLAEGHIGTQAVMQNALEVLQGAGLDVEYACCIYPTALMLDPLNLNNALQTLLHKADETDYVFAVTRATPAPQKMLRADALMAMTPVWPQFDVVETQKLEPRYHDAGQFYWGHAAAFREGRPLAGPRARGYPLPRYMAIDIDDHDDLRLATYVLKGYLENPTP